MGKKHKNAGKHKKKPTPPPPDVSNGIAADVPPASAKKRAPKKKTTSRKDLAEAPEDRVYYTARHLLAALQGLDPAFLDMPLVLIHGRALQKPNLVQGILPSPVPVDRATVEAKRPSLLALGELVDL